MKNILFILSTLLITVLPIKANGQTKQYGNESDAVELVKNAIDLLKSSAYNSRFTLDYYSSEKEKTETKFGKIDLKGRLFRVEMADTEIKFNGKTQWNYVAADNEVTITEPSRRDLSETNPMSMIESMMSVNRIVNAEQKVQKGFRVVFMYPHYPKKVEYFKITLYISQETGLPKKIVINQRNGDKISMSFLDLRKVNYNPSKFYFKQSEYPNVTVNDLR